MIKLNGNFNVKVTPTKPKAGVGDCCESPTNNLQQFLDELWQEIVIMFEKWESYKEENPKIFLKKI